MAPAGVPPELTELEEVLLANPARGLRTIRSPGAGEVLRDILGGMPTSHRRPLGIDRRGTLRDLDLVDRSVV